MNNKRLVCKICFVFIWVSLLIPSLYGCSFIRNLIGSPSSSSTSRQEGVVTQKDLTDFFSNVRPHRESVESVFARARFFQDNRKYRLAIQEYRTVLKLDPNHVEAYNNMGVCCDLLGEYGLAVSYYKKALTINPELAHIQNNLGYSYFLQGNLDASIRVFKKAIDLDSERAIYHNNLGLVYAEKGLLNPAFEEFALSGGTTKAHYNIAQLCLKKNLDDEAQFHLTQAENTTESPSSGESQTQYFTTANESFHHESGGKSSDLAFTSNNNKKENEAGIEVSNGNGVRFMARDVSRYLSKKGFTVRRLTNAKTFSHDKTVVYYRDGYMDRAYGIAKELPGWSEMIQVQELERANIKIRLVIGKDIVIFRKVFLKV